ncbi:class I SAM-dependent methyltransferase [Streptomyces sp. TRM 70351]|uniref:class I SAM-dependent methyltransferase n=1 Tax=Streptomyces sp. TRM 70351 TaxID=3116552 RepID=UPI002E7BBF22|nr:class I SAM-dependent methyltransferase [Streptomyces sp. TRM 70351]MEE1931531.1 class I SAM-dependent methyltransferase [Streptomyces sp. TRM 70351]
MTRPDQPAAAAASDDDLFGSEAADYARYRPGLPDAAVRLLAATQHGVPDPVLLDLGTGTGQVLRALPPVLRRLVHVDLVDVNQHMLETALTILDVRGSCTVNAFSGEARTFTPTAPGRALTLITCCRSFHWMSRAEVLDMADRVAAPNAVVAIMGDGSLWAHEADWTAALRGLIQTSLGNDRRAGTRGTYAGRGRSYDEELADSAFSDVAEHRFPVARAWRPEDVLGYLRTTSFAGPALFADRHHEFEAEALRLLQGLARGGVLKEDAAFSVLLARRPGGDA